MSLESSSSLKSQASRVGSVGISFYLIYTNKTTTVKVPAKFILSKNRPFLYNAAQNVFFRIFFVT